MGGEGHQVPWGGPLARKVMLFREKVLPLRGARSAYWEGSTIQEIVLPYFGGELFATFQPSGVVLLGR